MASKLPLGESVRRLFLCVVAMTAAIFPGSLHAQETSPAISFVNDVVPVLTKAGCNAGVCHAEAEEDYEHIVKENRGRRLFLSAPENSLLLTKASGKTPHGGGLRIKADSQAYQILLNWIRQGATFDGEVAPKLLAVDVQPGRGTVQRNTEQQLKAVAKYSDGSERDVTEQALFESNDKSMADVSDRGLVKVLDIPGKVAIMVRYQGRITVFNASIPLGAPVENVPPSKNFVDDLVFANLKEIGVPPSSVCDDATYLRRITLDISGRLPTEEESRAFLANTAADKRDQVIDNLLSSPEYADFFANKWTAMLKNRRDDASDITSNFAFYAWVRDSLLANKPYDQMVRELLAATGTVIANPPVAWYKRVKEPKQQLEDVAQLFLGVRMQCAQCHHHPFERWSQDLPQTRRRCGHEHQDWCFIETRSAW